MSSVPDESIVENGIQLPGKRLLIARESQSYTQQAIADELHLPVRYIQWIEDSAYEKLPSLVFARGYIRSYAKIVGVDGAPLIEMLDQSNGVVASREPIRSVSKVQQQVKLGDPVMRWSSWLFLLIVVAAIGWWWKTQYSLAPVDGLMPAISPIADAPNDTTLKLPVLDDSVDSENVVNELVAEVKSNDEPTYLSEADIAKLQEEVDLKTSVSNEIPVAISPSLEVEVEEKVVAPLLAEDPLQISFVDDCWLTVKDGSGKTLFSSLRKAGQTLNLSGEEPLRVLIGRVSAINQVTYKGAVIDLKPFSNKNVAKFTLPLN
ncbi:RodZ domain-containing protein [Neptunomonas sp.]|uniref:RodZ domain-containing protein n=1 Tax=Neptunomonas sp. TaxID=1971898 RepID=UPI0025FB672C|nr:RodZ domain-containing protein [Neptunomonas sp.]